jgi:hypothetical protein
MTEVDICNLALARCGVSTTIASLDEASKEAKLCKRFYAFCRDYVLEQAPWPFAVKVQALSPQAVSTLLPGWDYGYAWPTDALTMLEVVPAGAVTESTGYYTDCCGPWMPQRSSPYAWRRALAAGGNTHVVLSGLDDAYGVYVARVTNTGAFSEMFASLVADRLAMELSTPMTVDPRWFNVVQQRFAAAFVDTSSRQYEQEKAAPPAVPLSIQARG